MKHIPKLVTYRALGLGLMLSLGALVSACGGGTATTTTEMSGEALYNGTCKLCHGDLGAGTLGPNITGSTTAGIGSWTEAQFLTTLRDGVDNKGKGLCAEMEKYPATKFSDAEVQKMYDYLLAQKNDTVNRGSTKGTTLCP